MVAQRPKRQDWSISWSLGEDTDDFMREGQAEKKIQAKLWMECRSSSNARIRFHNTKLGDSDSDAQML